MRPTEIIYIGDGTPTWGITSETDLVDHARAAVGSVPVHAALLGKGKNDDLWRQLTGRLGGKLAEPRTALDAQRFAMTVRHSRAAPRLRNAFAVAPKGAVAYPKYPTTLFAGDEITFVMRTEAGAAMPRSLTLRGESGGKTYTQHVALAGCVLAAQASFLRHQLHHLLEIESFREHGSHAFAARVLAPQSPRRGQGVHFQQDMFRCVEQMHVLDEIHDRCHELGHWDGDRAADLQVPVEAVAHTSYLYWHVRLHRRVGP